MGNRQVPALRFQGFTDAWEQRKFGDVGSVAMCKRIFKEQTSDEGEVPFYKIGTFGDEPDAFISRELFDEYKAKYPYPNKGDILISASGSIGRTVEFTGKDEYFQDSNIVWLKHGNEIDNSFLKVLYGVVEWSCEGSTIKRLYNDNFLKTEFMLPQIDEQKKIGVYFSNLDHLITLHQCKHEKLQRVKKSMLEKMFPRNGAKVPEIRFDGFTGAWEQRKLGELIRLNGRIGFRGYTEKDIVSKDDGGVLTFSPTNIVDNKLTTNCKNTYITRFKYDESPEIKIHNGDILFVKTGSTLGKSALVTGLLEDATLNPQVVVMRTNKADAEFLSAMLITNYIISQVNSAKIGGAVPTLTETRIKDFDVAIPASEVEKKQIGQFFTRLDHLITLHQRELEKLKNIKKSMLEKMFV